MLDLVRGLRGGKGRDGKGRGWNGLRDAESFYLLLEVRNLVPQLYLQRGRKGGRSGERRVVLRD